MGQDDEAITEAITEARIAGTSTRALAKQHHISSREVDAAVDRCLDYQVDNAMRLRLVKLNVERIEALMKPFYERATSDTVDALSVAAGSLYCKLAERLSLLLGLDQSPTARVDVYQVQAQEQPSDYERIRAAIYAVARPNGRLPSGNSIDAIDAPTVPDTSAG